MPEDSFNPKPVLHSILLSDRLRPEFYRFMQGVDCQQVARSFQGCWEKRMAWLKLTVVADAASFMPTFESLDDVLSVDVHELSSSLNTTRKYNVRCFLLS